VWEKERLGRSLDEICARKEVWEREIGGAWEEEWGCMEGGNRMRKRMERDNNG
jgi:hypothetical protein